MTTEGASHPTPTPKWCIGVLHYSHRGCAKATDLRVRFFGVGTLALRRPLFGRSCVLRAVWEIPRRLEPAEREGGRPDNLTPRRPGAEAIARPPPRDDAPAVGGRRRARRTGFVTTPRQTLWQRVKQPQEVPRLLRPRCPGGPRSRRRGLRCRMPPSCLPLHPYLSHY